MSRKIITNLKYALLAGASLAATSAWAQDGAEPAEGTEVEAITVVGSNIKGAKVTGVLPVTVMELSDIEATGATSGDELFRSIPQAGDVSFNEARSDGGINDARGDTASINLRGLGTGNTLMLLNGRRLVLHPAIQVENLIPVTTVNTNAIPVKGVRRVEVLRDGAAAIYGTDAVAGVINTVLKSNFDGLTVEGEYTTVEDSNQREWEVGFEWGKTFNGGRTNVSLFGTYLDRTPLWAADRNFSASSDQRSRLPANWAGDTQFDNRSTVTPWGEFRRLTNSYANSTTTASYNGVALTTSGVFHVQPGGNEGCVAPGQAAGTCFDNSTLSTASTDANLKYNANDGRTLMADTERLNLFGFFNHEFDNGVEAYAELGYYQSQTWSQRDQEAALASQRLIVPITGYWNPFGPVGSPNRLPGLTGVATAGVPLQVLDYRVSDAGYQTFEVEQTVERYLVGFRGDFRGWDWDSALVYSKAETQDTIYTPSMTLLQEAIARTDATAYNPFLGGNVADPSSGDVTGNPQDVIDSFMVDVTRVSHTSMALWDFKVSNPDLFKLPAGGLGVAAGVELRRETYGDDRDKRLDGTITYTALDGSTFGSDAMGASPTPDTSGARNVQAAFIELAVPIVSPDMGIPLVRSLDLQLAARYENYSVFGSTTKPKIALSWYPFEFLQFRTAWSEGFRAPSLPQLYERGIERSNSGREDWIDCELLRRQTNATDFAACTSSISVASNRSGSKDLTPEESENFTAGVVFQPTFIPREFGRFTFTVDYWSVDQTDIIGLLGDQNQLVLDYYMRVNNIGPGYNENVRRTTLTPAEQAPWIAAGLQPAGEVIEVIDNYQNLNPREVEGVDLGVFYSIDDTPIGDFDVKINAAKLLTFYQTPSSIQETLLDAIASGQIPQQVVVNGAEDLVEQNGRPEWRWSATVTWRKDQWGAGYYTSYVGGVDDTGATNDVSGELWRVDDWQTHNMYVQYTIDSDGPLDRTRIRFGGRNIFNEKPPLADETFGYFGSLHSPRGSTWYMQVRKRF